MRVNNKICSPHISSIFVFVLPLFLNLFLITIYDGNIGSVGKKES